MPKLYFLLTGIILCQLLFPAVSYSQQLSLKNNAYQVSVSPDAKQLTITRNGATPVTRPLTPTLQILFSAEDPKLEWGYADGTDFPVAAWKGKAGKANNKLYQTGQLTAVTATKARQQGNQLVLEFPKQNRFTAKLLISLPAGSEAPVLEMQVTPTKAGWYSAGLTALAERDTAQLKFMYQPMVWSWRRFPDNPYLSPENICTTAATFINDGQITEGVAPDLSEIPYRYAKLPNSRFGLTLRNPAGKAQPAVFAPVLGAEDSYRKAGQTIRFKIRYLLQSGDWYTGVQYLLRDVLKYRNERQNAAVSLNQTLDNMINFGMHDKYGGWIDSLKGYDYQQDAVGTVKVVSALHALGTAMVTGNEEIYKRRALPNIEYVMSREKYLYSVDEKITVQNPSHFLKGPCVEIGELSGLHQFTNGQTPAFLAETNRLFGKPRKLNLLTETGGGSWQDYMARYRMTRNPADLEAAKAGADNYLQFILGKYPTNFASDPGLRDKQAAFTTDFTPKLYDLLELYEVTQDKHFLEASVTAARQMLLWFRSNPLAPDSIITVNEGGVVKGFMHKWYKVNSYEHLPNFEMSSLVPEQQVAAWQTSLVGLPPEQPRTYLLGGPIMLAHHAAWLLRLAHLANDSLFSDAAYNAMVGRYANFPGYYFTSLHTNIYQQADYPMHPYWDLKYNAIFHNHIWPHIALLIDFIVSDSYRLSKGNVNFPSTYAPGYAFLTSKIYGNQPGTIYGNQNLRLWLPPDALQTADVSVNHVLGVGEKDFFVVLMSTSPETSKPLIRLNPDKIAWVKGKTYPVTLYDADGRTSQTTLKDGLLNVSVPARGIVTAKIEGLQVDVPLFRSMAETPLKPGESAFFRKETGSALGTVTGMLITTFPGFSDAYLYTDATEKQLQSVSLKYRIGTGEWQTKEDVFYPFEFSIHLKNPKDKLEFQLTATDAAGKQHLGEIQTLSNQ